MKIEEIEKVTIENSIAIGKLTEISARTSSDVDAIMTHMEKIVEKLPLYSEDTDRITKLEKKVEEKLGINISRVIFVILLTYIVSFGTYVELKLNSTKLEIETSKSEVLTRLNLVEKDLNIIKERK